MDNLSIKIKKDEKCNEKKLNYLDFKNAITKSLDLVNSTQLSEMIPLNCAIGRVLSKDVICRKKSSSF